MAGGLRHLESRKGNEVTTSKVKVTELAISNTVTAMIEPLVTLDEAARILRRSHWTLREDFKAGRMLCVRIGRKLMVEGSELRRIIDAGRQ
jgi:hypothetical protein